MFGCHNPSDSCPSSQALLLRNYNRYSFLFLHALIVALYDPATLDPQYSSTLCFLACLLINQSLILSTNTSYSLLRLW